MKITALPLLLGLFCFGPARAVDVGFPMPPAESPSDGSLDKKTGAKKPEEDASKNPSLTGKGPEKKKGHPARKK